MPLQRSVTGASLIDVLDHVLDKGIVIDAWVNVSVAGIDLLSVQARIVVASIETYVRHAGTIPNVVPISLPAPAPAPAPAPPPVPALAPLTLPPPALKPGRAKRPARTPLQ